MEEDVRRVNVLVVALVAGLLSCGCWLALAALMVTYGP